MTSEPIIFEVIYKDTTLFNGRQLSVLHFCSFPYFQQLTIWLAGYILSVVSVVVEEETVCLSVCLSVLDTLKRL